MASTADGLRRDVFRGWVLPWDVMAVFGVGTARRRTARPARRLAVASGHATTHGGSTAGPDTRSSLSLLCTAATLSRPPATSCVPGGVSRKAACRYCGSAVVGRRRPTAGIRPPGVTIAEAVSVGLLGRMLGAVPIVTGQQVRAAHDEVRRTPGGDDILRPVAIDHHPEGDQRPPDHRTHSAAVGQTGHPESMGISNPFSPVNRAARPDFRRWKDGSLPTGGCVRPVRLRPWMFQAGQASGRSTDAEPFRA